MATRMRKGRDGKRSLVLKTSKFKRPRRARPRPQPEANPKMDRIIEDHFANKPRTSTVIVQLNPTVYEHLCSLISTGLYGWTVEDAAERMICEALRPFLRRT